MYSAYMRHKSDSKFDSDGIVQRVFDFAYQLSFSYGRILLYKRQLFAKR